MLKKVGCTLLLLGVLSALDIQWAVLQGVAWTTMLTQEMRQQTEFREAVERTFGGEYPCDMCGIVAANLKETPMETAIAQKEFLNIKLLPLELDLIQAPENTAARSQLTGWKQTAALLYFTPEPPPPRRA